MLSVVYSMTVEGELFKSDMVETLADLIESEDFEEEDLTVEGIIEDMENQVSFELEDNEDNIHVEMELTEELQDFLEEVIKEVKERLKEPKK